MRFIFFANLTVDNDLYMCIYYWAGVMESFDDHPPLVIPSHSIINLSVRVEDKTFNQHLDYLNATYGHHQSEGTSEILITFFYELLTDKPDWISFNQKSWISQATELADTKCCGIIMHTK